MKQYLLAVASALLLIHTALGQEVATPDTVLQFNRLYTSCENQWVAIPPVGKADPDYGFGFFYIDPIEGFSFNFEGYFTIKPDEKFTRLAKKAPPTYKFNYRNDKRLLAVITQDHFEELDIYSKPDWLKLYSEYTDTIAHNIAWGRAYNRENCSAHALPILLKVQQQSPHADGLDFELAYAYNALMKPDDAITLLNNALKNKPDDVLLTEELGVSYLNKNETARGIACIKTAIDKCSDEQLAEKTEMALQIALASKKTGDLTAYSQWITKANAWAPKFTAIYQKVYRLINQP